jgi:hypothetical protein
MPLADKANALELRLHLLRLCSYFNLVLERMLACIHSNVEAGVAVVYK